MKISKSLRRRYALIKGESFPDAVKIFFSSRRDRRAMEAEKFGVPTTTNALDEEWYAKTHGLATPSDAAGHYYRHGSTRALAPNPELAGEDGITLAQWAVEFLVRTDVAVGPLGSEAMPPGDARAINPFDIDNPQGKKIAVVTAIFGEFDRLLPIDPAWLANADFFAFTDAVLEPSHGWTLVHSAYHNADPRRCARFVKLHLPTFFSDYDWVFWLDGNVLLCQDPQLVLEALDSESFDFATFEHPDRSNLVAEAAACFNFGKEDPVTLARHLKQHQNHAAFRGTTLYETMVLVLRPSSQHVRDMCAKWWRSIMRGSKRDQLSLPLAVADTQGLRVEFLPDSISRSRFFTKATHVR
ncbi:MAG: glycosyltransferase domain-containing protein [Pseudomonadota bacterium]